MRKFLLLTLILVLTTVNPCFAVTQWRNGAGDNTILGTENASDIDSVSYNNIVAPLDNLLSKYREGCAISYVSASSISVGIGQLVLSNSDGSIRLMANNTAATTVTFSDLDAGAEATSTTYYVWAVVSAVSDTTFTVKLSTSSTAPSGITYYRRLGNIYNDSSSNIQSDKIVNDNNYYALKLGDWVAKTANVAYTASTDGYALALGTDPGVTGTYISIATDTSSPPTTARSKTHVTSAGSYVSVFSPVKKGNNWKEISTAPTVTVYWIPMEGDL
jgi:hypothetical protein